jgi:hypothetical protein
MAIFYRGVGAGSYWNTGSRDPRMTGFTPQDPRVTPSTDQVMRHVIHGPQNSPYVSLTRSWGVALHYARNGRVRPTSASPAHIWVIEISDPLPPNVSLVDPVVEVATSLPAPQNGISYQHDGLPTCLIGLIDVSQRQLILDPIPVPPGSNPPLTAPNITVQLKTIVFGLRDAEILAVGTVPCSCIKTFHEII